jgi:predicted GTPase
MVFRDASDSRVIAFTATQIPGISERRYPASLAGSLYPDGIPILDEANLEEICRAHQIEQVVFAYSDVTHEHVMHLASRAEAMGADFVLLGPTRTMLQSVRPVIAVSGVRTGCGKSQIARFLSRQLRERGKRAAVLRHPMPYGDLAKEKVQRFARLADLDTAQCTVEEREEYEPHLSIGNIVFAGVDYAAILNAAEKEADIIIWDGGNNDFPFLKPDLHLVVIDALRPDQIATHHPGETVARMADIAIINKVDAATEAAVARAIHNFRSINGKATILRAASPVRLDDVAAVRGKRVIVVEDGPTITHGGLGYGAGYVAALAAGATILDPRGWLVPPLDEFYHRYPHIGHVLPAIGYNEAERRALAATVNAADVDVVVAATPIDLERLISLNKRVVRARYEFADAGSPTLASVVAEFLKELECSP